MNALTALLVRTALLVFFLAPTGFCAAQKDDGSLTGGFDKLSAKERSKIAARETAEAAKDTTYQALMRKADIAFQAKHYQEALATFEQARVLRPYNVYPKVKIQDLQALIKKKDLENSHSAPTAVLEMDTASAPADIRPPVVVPNEQPAPLPEVRNPDPTPPARHPAERSPAAEAPATPVHDRGAAPIPPQTGKEPSQAAPPIAPAPVALGERVYMEAGAVVTERTVEDEGKPVVYKKVVHAWGQTFYFKEGHAIPRREWDARFTE